MPTPSRTSTEQIVAAGRAILEAEGFEGLTMQRVAAAVGVRAPSLYKRVDGRGELVRLITIDVPMDLSATLEAAAVERRPGDATSRRSRSRSAGSPTPGPRPTGSCSAGCPRAGGRTSTSRRPGSRALFETVGTIAGPDDRLEAARTVVAWANGFVSMELAGAFRLGGDVDRAFAYGAAAHRRSDQRAAARRATMSAMRNEALVADLRWIVGRRPRPGRSRAAGGLRARLDRPLRRRGLRGRPARRARRRSPRSCAACRAARVPLVPAGREHRPRRRRDPARRGGAA